MQKSAQKHTKKINLNLELFEQSIKSEFTRNVYIVCLKKYFQFPSSSKFVECDHTTDPRNVEKHIIDYIISLKKEGKGYSGIKNYVSAISKCQILGKQSHQPNDIDLTCVDGIWPTKYK